MEQSSAGERGNVMIYILIAIALLGALVMAVAQGGRGGANAVTEERENAMAMQILSFGDTVEKAVTQLRLRGTKLDVLRFSHPDLPAAYGVFGAAPLDEVFNPQGAAAVYGKAPAEAILSGTGDYQFLGNTEVVGAGTTCGAASCADLVMILGGLRSDVCIAINRILRAGTADDPPPADDGIDQSGEYAGTFSYAATLGDDAGAAVLSGTAEACFEDEGTNEFIYYKVLVPR